MLTIEEAYEQAKPIIYSLVNRYPMNDRQRLDLLAEANYWFVRIYHSYDPSKSSLTTWVYTKLEKQLLAIRRREQQHNTCSLVIDVAEREDRLGKLLDSLTREAQEIITLLLDPPPEFTLRVCRKRTPSPKIARTAMKEWLLSSGWTRTRISEAFAEIREALR